MKKTYINQLPKNKKVKDLRSTIENNQIITEVEFEENFKDGDILFAKLSLSTVIFIYKYTNSNNAGCYYGIQEFQDKTETWSENRLDYINKMTCRFATKKEKVYFLTKLLNKYNKIWNQEKKCLENIN